MLTSNVVALAVAGLIVCSPLIPASAEPAPAATSSTAQTGTNVTFSSEDGILTGGAPTQIPALLFRPTGTGPFSAIVALHGCAGMYGDSGTRLSKHMQDWADRFVAAGYVVIFPDSFTPRGQREVCTHAANIRPEAERSRDAWGARAWLERQTFVRHERIGIVGWLHGGATALWAVDQTISAFRHGRSDFRAAVAFYPPCKAIANDAAWATSTTLEILIGANDDWSAASDCKFLAGRARSAGDPVTFVAFPNAYHGFDNPGQSIESLQGVLGTASHTATYGTNDAARRDSIARVMALFEERLK